MLARAMTASSRPDDEVRALRERIEELEEENRQLVQLLRKPISYPRAWHLSHQESQLLAVLHTRNGVVSVEHLRTALARYDQDISDSHLGVVLCRARRKLKPVGVVIRNARREGFYLTAEARRILDDAQSAVAAGEAA